MVGEVINNKRERITNTYLYLYLGSLNLLPMSTLPG